MQQRDAGLNYHQHLKRSTNVLSSYDLNILSVQLCKQETIINLAACWAMTISRLYKINWSMKYISNDYIQLVSVIKFKHACVRACVEESSV